MKNLRNILAVGLLMAGTYFTACAQTQIPLENFFKNPEKIDYQVSPDGTYFSFMAPYENRLNLFVQKIGSDTTIRITSEKERDITASMWAGNNRILFIKDTGGDENYQLYGVNIDGSDLKSYTNFPNVRTTIIDPLRKIDSLVIIGMNKRNPQVFDPYRLNLNTGELTLLAENPGNIQGWMTDHDGKLRVANAIVDGVNNQILYRETEDQPFQPVLTTNFKETVSFAVFTPDNKMVYALTNIGRDKTALVLMEPKTCEEKEVLYMNDKYDISDLNYSEKKNRLTVVACEGHKDMIRHYFDKDEEEIRKKLEAQLPGYNVGVTSMSKDENIRLIYAGNDRTYGTYYLYNVKENKLTKVADIAPWIKEEEMCAMNPITYTSRDGLTIEGYLTLPKGYTMENAKNLPVVVNPHGGPWIRDSWGYNPEVQFLASRGYAVLQMNFRASTGYGRKFTELGYKQWGQTMQNDITDGVKWLIKEGIADPKRVAIYGASYGGYATLAGVTFTPDLYACAVDYVGVSNLLSFMNTIPPYWKPLLDMMHEMIGDPETDKEMMEKYSPVFHVDQIKAPLFIAQGANDPRVNKAESDQMVEALKKRGVEVEYMVKENEGHGFSNEENKFDFYRAMEKFLDKYLK
ncbi:MAG TPA: S9 family peptidase [Candidatus Prevotella avicola]|uniref:S9 family peptidase n=1 Tax=Candidatus Prevotella avicola TaxID=2838738 RepID=A0A9D2FZX4_9BACT|nr:S9 family peptidase [Candidatus Prevotella avicola]